MCRLQSTQINHDFVEDEAGSSAGALRVLARVDREVCSIVPMAAARERWCPRLAVSAVAMSTTLASPEPMLTG